MDLQDKHWGRHTGDWAAIQEPQGRDGYLYVLGILPRAVPFKLLDIGCGTGSFLELAAARGIDTTGIDASKVFVEQAKHRLPSGSFFTADMEKLPFEDASFGAVCGFNSFQYATDLDRAVWEAKRVLETGGRLIVLLWGNKALCGIAAFLKSVYTSLSFGAPDGPGAFALSESRLLDDALTGAGFSGITTTDIPARWNYPDRETAAKGLLSLGALASIVDRYGIEKAREVVVRSLLPYTQPDGTVVIQNQYRIVVCEKK